MIKFIIEWLGTTKVLTIPRRYVGRILDYYYVHNGKVIYQLTGSLTPEEINGLDLIRQIKKETEMLLADQEAYLIYQTVKKTEKIEGDIAEVGIYKGASAKLIRGATKKHLYLFDTFEGLPSLCAKDDPKRFQKGNYSAVFEDVKNYLKDCRNIHFYRGRFPLTADPIKDKQFSFVHLDVDIYESTLNCLKFFYPRMSRGGVIISHDYHGSDGVKAAFDEFFDEKPEIIIEVYSTDQCVIVKV